MADSRDLTREFMKSQQLIGIVLSVQVSALVGGCAPGGGWFGRGRRIQDPQTVVTAYAEALAARDPTRAQRLLRADDRKALDPTRYAQLLQLDRVEAEQLAARLAHAGDARVSARVELDDGSELWLELEGDRFVVVDPLSRYYGQASPREALRSFVRAVEHARWDVVLALMPNAEREGVDAKLLGEQLSARREELTRMTALLASELDAPIEVVGDRATMPYGESFTARLVREDQLWKLEDPD